MCVIILLGCFALSAHSQQEFDTLTYAVKLHEKGSYKEEYTLLAQYRKTHKADVNTEWLYGQAAFFMGKSREMMQVYEANIAANTDNYYLRLDYAFKLVEVGQLEKAKKDLKTYLPYDTANAQIYASLAKIEYWQSNYKVAYSEITNAIRLAPNNTSFVALRDEVELAMSPWVSAGFEVNNDNQPIYTELPSIEGGMFFGPLAITDASVQEQRIFANGKLLNAQYYKIGNKSLIAKYGLMVRLQAGAVHYPVGKTKATGLVGVDETLFKAVTITAQAERKPYLSMLRSLDTTIATTDVTASIKWIKPGSFMGQVAYTVSLFDDDNQISTRSAWVVTPELKLWKLGFRVGYGYSFTTSKTDMYNPVKNKAELFEDIYYSSTVAGSFDPYLTPKNQEVNSVIGVVTFKPAKALSFTLSGSYGFKASIKTPFLYGYYDDKSNVIVAKDFYKEKYTTLDLHARADVHITRRLSAKIEYGHSHPNFYYTNDNASVGLKMIL